jgi:hypothetical protein
MVTKFGLICVEGLLLGDCLGTSYCEEWQFEGVS